MNTDSDKLKAQASMDGQLPIDSMIEFEAGLTPEEKDAMEKERRFEAELADRLRAGGECPDALC